MEDASEIKYRNMKKRYKELELIRKTNVKENCNDLFLKIKEHEQIHKISLNELRRQNDQLQNLTATYYQNEIERLKQSILKIIKQISEKNILIGTILKFPELKYEILNPDKIQITCCPQGQWVFILEKNNQKITYCPVKVPSQEITDFLNGQIEFEASANMIELFCSKVITEIKENF